MEPIDDTLEEEEGEGEEGEHGEHVPSLHQTETGDSQSSARRRKQGEVEKGSLCLVLCKAADLLL